MSTETGNRPDVRKGWLTDVLIGGISGGLVGAVAAVNVVIYAGIERGYEATIPEVFRESALVGSVVVAILLAGPLVGVWIARRRRRQRTSRRDHG
jgi:hypothetical protein